MRIIVGRRELSDRCVIGRRAKRGSEQRRVPVAWQKIVEHINVWFELV